VSVKKKHRPLVTMHSRYEICQQVIVDLVLIHESQAGERILAVQHIWVKVGFVALSGVGLVAGLGVPAHISSTPQREKCTPGF